MINFSKPQRQSPVGIIVMFADTVQKFARAFWPILLVLLFRSETSKLLIGLGILLLIIIIAVIAYLKYVNFTFYIDEENDEFIISEGIFNKSRTTINLDKIQQVNINQSLIQRVINVYELNVDSAGSTSKEGQIKAVSHQLAIALKAQLLDNERPTETVLSENEESSKEVNEPFIKISLLSLLKIGITSNYVRSFALILAFLITIYENVRKLVESETIDATTIDTYLNRATLLNFSFYLIILLVAGILIINLIRTVVKYYNFQMTKKSGSLLLSFGLLNTKSTILRPQRVQIAAITRNFFQKKLNISSIKIRQAGGADSKNKQSLIEIPGCNASEQNEILKLLYDVIPEKGAVLMPNIRKVLSSIFVAIVLPLVVFLVFIETNAEYRTFAWMAVVYVISAVVILYFSFKNYRLFVQDRFVIKQSGAWDITTEIVETTKIQAIATSQMFWHRKLDIGSLVIHTAGGKLRFTLGNYTKIKLHVDTWLYEIETSNSNWM